MFPCENEFRLTVLASGHELGFKAHLTVGAKRAIGRVTEWKVPMTMEVDGKVFRYCPKALCDG